jgi:hypothetical protein
VIYLNQRMKTRECPIYLTFEAEDGMIEYLNSFQIQDRSVKWILKEVQV